MTAKFTKGRWIVGECSGQGVEILAAIQTEYGERRKRVGFAKGSRNKNDYNAALIACAPEMYEMLEKLSMQLTAINAHKAVDDIERLLAKTRGEA